MSTEPKPDTTRNNSGDKLNQDNTNKKPVPVTAKSSPPIKQITPISKPSTALPGKSTSPDATIKPIPPATNTANITIKAERQRDELQVVHVKIQKQLNIRLAFNHHYPTMAIRRAWEGRVNLSIRVLANGELTNIHIIDSSGYSILDKAAVRSIIRIAALPQARQWLQGRNIDVILPVIYKLTDS